MATVLRDTVIWFLLVYACLDIGRRAARFLTSRLSAERRGRSYAVVFSNRNDGELEATVRWASRGCSELYVVDVDTSDEGRRILDCLSREINALHVVTERELAETLPLLRDGKGARS